MPRPWDGATPQSAVKRPWDGATNTMVKRPWGGESPSDPTLSPVVEDKPLAQEAGELVSSAFTMRPGAQKVVDAYRGMTNEPISGIINAPPEPVATLPSSPLQAQMQRTGMADPAIPNTPISYKPQESLVNEAKRAAEFALTTPNTIASQLIGETFGSVAGVATLPLIPLGGVAGAKALGGAIIGARDMAAARAALNAAADSRSIAGIGIGLAGKGAGKVVGGVASGAGKVLEKISPEASVSAKRAAARFIRPDELATEMGDADRVLRSEYDAVRGISEAMDNKVPAEQLEKLTQYSRVAQEERVAGLRKMRNTASRIKMDEANAIKAEIPRKPNLKAEVRKLETGAREMGRGVAGAIDELPVPQPDSISELDALDRVAEAAKLKAAGADTGGEAYSASVNRGILPPPQTGFPGKAGAMEDIAQANRMLGARSLLPEALQEGEVARQMMRSRAAEALKESRRIAKLSLGKFAETLSPETRSLLTQYAKEKGFAEASPEMKALADEIFQRNQTYADRQIAAGADSEAFHVYEGVYMPQLYTGKEIELAGKGMIHHGYPQVTEARLFERNVQKAATAEKLGASDAAKYTVVKGAMQEAYDSAVAESFQRISQTPSLAGDVARDSSWFQMPTNSKLGLLSGKWVHPSVKYEIDGVQRNPQFFGQMLDKWVSNAKQAVTIWNPPVHFGNILSNAILMDFAGFPSHDVVSLKEALKSMRNEDEIYKAIRAAGGPTRAFQYSQKELDAILNEAIKTAEHSKEGQDFALEHLIDVLVKGPKSNLNPNAAYQAEEMISKYILSHYAYTKGISQYGLRAGNAIDAVRHAEKWLINYADLPVGFRELRSSGAFGLIASPFITFPMKVTPLMAEGLIRQPHKFVKWHAMLSGWNEAARREAGVSDEEWASYRAAKVDQAQGIDKFFAQIAPEMVFPNKVKDGKFYAMNVSRFTPWGFAGTMAQGMGIGGFGTNLAMQSAGLKGPNGMGQGFATETFGTDSPSVSSGAQKLGMVAKTVAMGLPGPKLGGVVTRPFGPLGQRALGATLSPFAEKERTGPLLGPNIPERVLKTLNIPVRQSTYERISPIQRALAMTFASPYRASAQSARRRVQMLRGKGAEDLEKAQYWENYEQSQRQSADARAGIGAQSGEGKPNQ